MTPKEIAEKAASLISGDRNRSHGNARDNFENIAALWNVYLQKKSGGRHLTARDVGIMMALLKVARTLTGAHTLDDYVDGVGYLALSGGMAEEDNGNIPLCPSAWDPNIPFENDSEALRKIAEDHRPLMDALARANIQDTLERQALQNLQCAPAVI